MTQKAVIYIGAVVNTQYSMYIYACVMHTIYNTYVAHVYGACMHLTLLSLTTYSHLYEIAALTLSCNHVAVVTKFVGIFVWNIETGVCVAQLSYTGTIATI